LVWPAAKNLSHAERLAADWDELARVIKGLGIVCNNVDCVPLPRMLSATVEAAVKN
jgi:hypothetical protein